MKSGLVKIWVCQGCEKEHLERPLMCSTCECLNFYVKYGGILEDTNELSKLVDPNKDNDSDKKKKVRM